MASYIVLEPTDAVKLKPLFSKKNAPVTHVKGDHTVFVRDEFTIFALILPFVWLLTHRLHGIGISWTWFGCSCSAPSMYGAAGVHQCMAAD